MQRGFNSLLSTLSLAIVSCLVPVTAKAQVTPDGTTATTANQDGNNYIVEQGDRLKEDLIVGVAEYVMVSHYLFN